MNGKPDDDRPDADSERILSLFGEIYGASTGSSSPTEAAAIVLRTALSRLRADAAFVATVNADGRTVEALRVPRPESSTFVRLAFPLTSPICSAATLRHGQSLFIGSNFHLACDHPGLVRIQAEDHACATVPLADPDGRMLGAINAVRFQHPRDFTPADRSVVEELAAECSSILANAPASPAE